MKLLLAEDDLMLGTGMKKGLTLAGFQVDWVQDGDQAMEALGSRSYTVVLLDIGLPQADGLQVLRWMRQEGMHTPVVLATARDAIPDRISGLNLGADDYVTKPFDLDELCARIHALSRRAGSRVQQSLQLGRLELRPDERVATLSGRPLSLSHREFDLLATFMRQPGVVLSVQQIERHIYGFGEEIASNAVEVHLHHLRRKLEEPWIVNVRGVGYKLVPQP